MNTKQRLDRLPPIQMRLDGSRAAVNYCLVGMSGEVGEIMNKWKKILRGDGADGAWNAGMLGAFREDMEKEFGDVQWYLARAAEELRLELDVIATANIEKLESRHARGVIQGNGDDR